MSAGAIARLSDPKQVVQHVSGTASAIVDLADLRALLDAHATLEAAHTEALDALEKLEDACSSVASWSEECLDFSDGSRVTARAVLAKAGRR